jgi:stage III sporulation protein AB
LETDIHYGFTPLTDALMGIGTHSTSPIAGLFLLAAYKLNNMPHESAKTSWRSAIEEYWPATALGLNEQEILYRFGDTLGISDRDDQVKHLKLAVAQLQAEEDQAWDEQRKYERLCRALGVLSSILVIIIIY